MAESSSQTSSSRPTIDEFAETLQEEERWYQLGIFMGAPISELKTINDMKSQAACDILMLLIHLYDCLERKGRPLTWEAIATALRRLGNHALAEKIHSQHHNKPTPPAIIPQGSVSANPNPNIQHPVTNTSSDTTVHAYTITPRTIGTTSHTAVGTNDSSNDVGAVIVKHEHCPIFNEYYSLDETFNELLMEVKDVFMSKGIRYLDKVQDVLRRRCGLRPLTQEKTTPNAVFTRVEEKCSIINFRILVFLVRSLKLGKTLLEQLETLKGAVDRFKSSANMVELVDLIKSNQITPTGDQKMVKLKVREFWSEFTMEQFEVIINEIFLTLYDIMTHVTVTKGCICLNWIIPNIDTTELLPELPLELVSLVGVIYLHIGSDVIYNIEGEGCESIEAAMIQAIELKNTRAIELLLAVGCNPEVATYNGDNTVTNIVNVRPIESKESSSSSGSSHSVDHVCILGHNKHVEAIVDPASRGSKSEECISCIVKEKMVKHLHQENNVLQQKQREMFHEIDLLYLTIKNKDSELDELQLRAKEKQKLIDAEITLLKKSFEILQKEKKDAEITLLKKSFKISKKEKASSIISSTKPYTSFSLPHPDELSRIEREGGSRIEREGGSRIERGGGWLREPPVCKPDDVIEDNMSDVSGPFTELKEPDCLPPLMSEIEKSQKSTSIISPVMSGSGLGSLDSPLLLIDDDVREMSAPLPDNKTKGIYASIPSKPDEEYLTMKSGVSLDDLLSTEGVVTTPLPSAKSVIKKLRVFAQKSEEKTLQVRQPESEVRPRASTGNGSNVGVDNLDDIDISPLLRQGSHCSTQFNQRALPQSPMKLRKDLSVNGKQLNTNKCKNDSNIYETIDGDDAADWLKRLREAKANQARQAVINEDTKQEHEQIMNRFLSLPQVQELWLNRVKTVYPDFNAPDSITSVPPLLINPAYFASRNSNVESVKVADKDTVFEDDSKTSVEEPLLEEAEHILSTGVVPLGALPSPPPTSYQSSSAVDKVLAKLNQRLLLENDDSSSEEDHDDDDDDDVNGDDGVTPDNVQHKDDFDRNEALLWSTNKNSVSVNDIDKDEESDRESSSQAH